MAEKISVYFQAMGADSSNEEPVWDDTILKDFLMFHCVNTSKVDVFVNDELVSDFDCGLTEGDEIVIKAHKNTSGC